MMKDLSKLNCRIKELGLAVSNHLIDAYAEADATSLKVVPLFELKQMFEHVKGKSSLIESWAGIGMNASAFVDPSVPCHFRH
jgi:hypothetical protein